MRRKHTLTESTRLSSGRSTAWHPLLGRQHRQEFLLHDEHRRAQLVQIELSAPSEQVVSQLPKLERSYRRMADLGQRRACRSWLQQQGKRACRAFHPALEPSTKKFAPVKVHRYQRPWKIQARCTRVKRVIYFPTSNNLQLIVQSDLVDN